MAGGDVGFNYLIMYLVFIWGSFMLVCLCVGVLGCFKTTLIVLGRFLYFE